MSTLKQGCEDAPSITPEPAQQTETAEERLDMLYLLKDSVEAAVAMRQEQLEQIQADIDELTADSD